MFLMLLLQLTIGKVKANYNVLKDCHHTSSTSVWSGCPSNCGPELACDQLLIHDVKYGLIFWTGNNTNPFWCAKLVAPKTVATVGVIAI